MTISRLAVLDRGEPAVRVLTAVAELAKEAPSEALTTLVVHDEPGPGPWWAREADEVVAVPSPMGAGGLVAALLRAEVDAVWIGPGLVADRAALAQQCEDAGLSVVGPGSECLRALADPDGLQRLADKAEVPCVPAAGSAGTGPIRRVEVDLVVDGVGTVWALGTRDVSVRREGSLVLAEAPCPGLDDATSEALVDAAARLAGVVCLRGSAAVGFALPVDAAAPVPFWLTGVDTHALVEQALVEETTGVDLVALGLRVAGGQRLSGPPPAAEGHAVQVRLRAQDPAAGFAPASGRVELLGLPAGAGVRVDGGVRQGDVLGAGDESFLASLTAWGRTRAEALARTRRALDRTSVVVGGGTTDRAFLLTLLGQQDVADARVDDAWLARFVASGGHLAAAHPVALLAAAAEAYDGDVAAVRATFHARAARGRPEPPEEVGARMQLAYGGVTYALRVDLTSPGHYRVRHLAPAAAGGGAVADVGVERVNPYERRLTCGGRRYRVLASTQGSVFRLEVDGAAHVVTREDGAVVRAGWPAFVVEVRAAPGDVVRAGEVVAVLESMKMETPVTAPFDGEVLAVDVIANAQVEAGAPLLRLRDVRPGADRAAPRAVGDVPLDLRGLERPADLSVKPCERVYGPLRDYLLGYDLDPADLRKLLTSQRRLGEIAAPADSSLIACEDSLLDLFADLGALSRPRTEADADLLALLDEEPVDTDADTQEYLIAFLQWLDADRAGLPAAYREHLELALTRYGVHRLDRTPALEAAVVWLYRSIGRVRELGHVVTAILERRLRFRDELAPFATAADRARLDRLSLATQGRLQAVADLARDVRFHFLDEPVLEAAVADVYEEMERHLVLLRREPDVEDRSVRIERLVWCPNPLRAHLLRHWLDAGTGPGADAFRRVLLEVYLRRFYRIRDVHDVTVIEQPGVDGALLLGSADYEHEGHPVHLVVAYTPLTELPTLSRAVAAHLTAVPAGPDIVVDLVTWRIGERPDIDALREEVAALLEWCAFGRPLHRLDLTVTSSAGSAASGDRGAGGSAEHLRTQHLTYRQAVDGAGEAGPLTEDVLYRNLHPMLGKRLELWRLSNFRLDRLLSAEDVYLFHGVAHTNPKDHRLFALAEVRDLTPVHDADSGLTTYPRLERMGLQALAAMRSARAAFPPRERPVANRIVLAVRPPWEVPASAWRDLAGSFAPLAQGAGLEKVVLRVRIPTVVDGVSMLRDSVLHVEGVGGHGVTVHEEPPGTEPVRPLGEYQRKVLVAQRFGVPYPYEVVRMFAPEAGTAGGLAPGSFVEHDLDAVGALVPVDRPPGLNGAHVVVGLMTTYTAVVPEGMTRVAILSDPTKGLGNLAEPECRRINAALELAARMTVPVEWFAVSSGALIAMDTGTENMDWIADTLRRIIEFTQGGGEINIVVTGINVGGQPYWNAEATMLMHTKGILVMTPASAMVLTGKQALDFSGGVSAEDNFGIGGYDRVMGPNGQAQYWAPSFEEACALLLRHYDLTYVVPGERFPRRRPTVDAATRDVREAPHTAVPGSDFARVGDVFDASTNPDRKKPFDIRSVMRAVADLDSPPLERWEKWRDAETSVVWDTCVGGIPVCMLGLESRTLPRRGFVPADGPLSFTSGTLFPQSSRKTARAVNAASGNRPLVVLANLSGFDGSPESMRRWQLEYGAEIGRAVTNFRGPIVFVVISRYHGGAFVVFSKALNASVEIAAVEGSYASVIGGAPAAATVFAREVKARTERDPRVVALREALATAGGAEVGSLRVRLAQTTDEVRSEKLGEVADEFDGIHTIERALRVGSVDRIIPAERLRPYVIDALERGMARTTT